MRLTTTTFLLLVPSACLAEIPDWYRRDIVQHVHAASAIVLYRVVGVSSHKAEGPYFDYRIETETINELKGQAPKGECYLLRSEGTWEHSPENGDTGIVILLTENEAECGAIEPGFGAPGSQEYVELFTSVLKSGN